MRVGAARGAARIAGFCLTGAADARIQASNGLRAAAPRPSRKNRRRHAMKKKAKKEEMKKGGKKK